MSDDELLREASDPTTSSERVREIWQVVLEAYEHSSEEEGQGLDALSNAIAVHPSLPLDLLRPALLFVGLNEISWHNPAVPLLLLAEPDPQFLRSALRQLSIPSEGYGYRADSLAELVALWSRHEWVFGEPPHQDIYEERIVRLARRLAELFQLPWPEPPDDPLSPINE